jgi:PAS domain S-box-containing protein
LIIAKTDVGLPIRSADRQIVEVDIRRPLSPSREFFASVLDASADVVVVVGVDGAIDFVNAAVSRVLGFEPDDCVGMPITELLHPDDREVAINRLAEWWSATDVGTRPVVVRAAHRDGRWVTVEAVGTQCFRLEHTSGMVVNVRDVSTRSGPRGREHEVADAGPVDPTETELGEALVSGGLELWYQPIRDLRSGTVVGFEGLLRWHRGEFGVIEAARFLPQVSGTPIMLAIGDLVLTAGCSELARWQRHLGADAPSVAINIPVDQLRQPAFASRVRTELERSGALPTGLCLELTETHELERESTIRDELAALRAIGVEVALDDFGTGCSSLGHLAAIDGDVLKLDRRFVDQVGVDVGATAIVKASLELGAAFGMITVAEGVSTTRQEQILREMACDRIQGSLVAPAMCGNAVVEWLSTGDAQPHPVPPARDVFPVRSVQHARRRPTFVERWRSTDRDVSAPDGQHDGL